MGNFQSIVLTANGEIASTEELAAARDSGTGLAAVKAATTRDVTAENAALARASREISGAATPVADQRALNEYEARRARYENETTRLQMMDAAGRPVPQLARERLQHEYNDLYMMGVRLGLIQHEG